jgi:hypothetical protein
MPYSLEWRFSSVATTSGATRAGFFLLVFIAAVCATVCLYTGRCLLVDVDCFVVSFVPGVAVYISTRMPSHAAQDTRAFECNRSVVGADDSGMVGCGT